MKREEYWKLHDIIDALEFAEDRLCECHCRQNKDNRDEVIRRQRDQANYKYALSQMRWEIRDAFYDKLEG